MDRFSLNKLPSDILFEIAERHRNLRKKLKLSQTELAQRSGVSLGSIKRFESTGQISLASLLKIAHLLGRLEDFNQVFAESQNENLKKLFRK